MNYHRLSSKPCSRLDFLLDMQWSLHSSCWEALDLQKLSPTASPMPGAVLVQWSKQGRIFKRGWIPGGLWAMPRQGTETHSTSLLGSPLLCFYSQHQIISTATCFVQCGNDNHSSEGERGWVVGSFGTFMPFPHKQH